MTETATTATLPGLPPAPPPPAPPKAAAKTTKAKATKPKAAAKKTAAKAKAKTKPAERKQAPQAEHGAQGNPASAADRDAKVLQFVKAKKAGRTLAEIQEKFGFARNIAYLSTYRGQKAGTIVKVSDGSRTPLYVAAENA